jgi:hypothetical protein
MFKNGLPLLLTAFNELFPEEMGVQVLFVKRHFIESNGGVNCVTDLLSGLGAFGFFIPEGLPSVFLDVVYAVQVEELRSDIMQALIRRQV